MPFFTVTEIWTNPSTGVFLKHTNEFRIRLHFQLDDMEAAGDFVRNTITGDRSIYTSDGSPVKIFTNRDAVDSYHAWLCKEYKPYDLIIEEWPDMAAVTDYLHKVRAVDIAG